jgi:hypothetical protein
MYDEGATEDSPDEISPDEASEQKNTRANWISKIAQESKPSPKRKKSGDAKLTPLKAFI